MKHIINTLAQLLLIALLSVACRPGSNNNEAEPGLVETDSGTYRIEEIVTGLEIPWEIVFTPDGRMLITERPGRVRVFMNDSLYSEPVAVFNDAISTGETGLMGMTLHPDFADNKLLYVAYAYESSDGPRVRIERFREQDNSFTDRTLILENIPAADNHAGCRLAFGPDRKLYVTTGDATERELAQELSSLAGKTLRLNDDGSAPSDNPFVDVENARPEIWTYGHRNAQGIAWQPGSGLQFQSEHGPSFFDGAPGGDEVNIVERGNNYGWPVIHHRETHPDMISPILEYTPALAPAGACFYDGDLLPDYQGNFFFACLRGSSIMRIILDGREPVGEERMFQDEFGRIRVVTQGPDGAIYFATSNRDGRGSPATKDDRILRIVPAQ